MAGVERRRTGAEMAPGWQGVVLPVCRRNDDGSGGDDWCQLQSRFSGRTVSDPPPAADFLAGRFLLRCEWRRTEIPDCHEGGRSQCRAALHPSQLGFADGKIEPILAPPSDATQ